ncbi:PREDICTED: 14 kDa zinc-binding protein-like [Camelina sativa]|uniref:14 kDa zinc-binding protein-like n=1 Tax=Camelina sativa TaxID=90675 RepID=A0ABM0VTK7_CAMSA|nr:PREDICTED: 14 kDa zinc-binding protein-like [Camelina sativa]
MAVTSSSMLLLRNFSTAGRVAQSVRATSRICFSTGELIRVLPHTHSTRFISSTRAAHNEEAAAKSAAAVADTGAPTIFDKIIAKEIPSDIVYEDENVLAFREINPQAPVHVLVIPKLRDGLTMLGNAEPRHVDVLGQLLHASKIVAEKEGILDGFRVVINNGVEACQSVYHLHLHVLGGRQLKWPPG